MDFLRRLVVVACAVGAVACGQQQTFGSGGLDDATPVPLDISFGDASSADAQMFDAGSGSEMHDAGSGSGSDGGTPDGGTVDPDGGTVDPDGGTVGPDGGGPITGNNDPDLGTYYTCSAGGIAGALPVGFALLLVRRRRRRKA